MAPSPPIPITIITGFLGSGKTTLILNLLPQLPSTKFALLKNEFGDVAIDTQLASSSSISGVQELLNGCICCNLVGQLSDALSELADTTTPDRIIIETSGSAFPATLAMEVNRLARETGRYVLDGVVNVIDVENWKGYEDTSFTAKVQAQYTDLIVLNKWEDVTERAFDICLDRVGDMDVPVAKEKSDKGWVDAGLVFGLDSRAAGELGRKEMDGDGVDGHRHDHQSEIEVLSISIDDMNAAVDIDQLQQLLEQAPKDEVYRIKAALLADKVPKASDGQEAASTEQVSSLGQVSPYILNWAFGRWKYTSIANPKEPSAEAIPALRMTVMTARGEAGSWKKRIENKQLIRLTKGGGVAKIEKIS